MNLPYTPVTVVFLLIPSIQSVNAEPPVEKNPVLIAIDIAAPLSFGMLTAAQLKFYNPHTNPPTELVSEPVAVSFVRGGSSSLPINAKRIILRFRSEDLNSPGTYYPPPPPIEATTPIFQLMVEYIGDPTAVVAMSRSIVDVIGTDPANWQTTSKSRMPGGGWIFTISEKTEDREWKISVVEDGEEKLILGLTLTWLFLVDAE